MSKSFLLRSTIAFSLIALSPAVLAQDAKTPPAPTAEDNARVNAPLPPAEAAMKAHVMFLASDAMKGRDAGSPEYAKTWQEMDQYIVDNALHLFLVWSPAVNAYNPKVVGKISYQPDVLGTARLDVWKTRTKAG